MPTIEQIYAAVVREGVCRGHTVVPEFCVMPATRLFQKKIDVAWLEPRDDPKRLGSLRKWKIVAAFEIEGYDVPVERIQIHSAQFQQLQIDEGIFFPCFVPLYTEAHHRANANWGNASPENHIEERQKAARQAGEVLYVCDGRNFEWLESLPLLALPECPKQKARKIPEISPLTAAALIASLGDVRNFEK